MKTSKLLLLIGLLFGISVSVNAVKYEAEDAEQLGDASSLAIYNDIPSSGGFYVQTAEASLKWVFDIDEAGAYDIFVWGSSGDEMAGREMQFCIDRAKTPSKTDADFATERFSVPFGSYTYSAAVAAGAHKKFTMKLNHTFTAGEHYVLMDKTDEGSWGWVRVDCIEVVAASSSNITDALAAQASIVSENGVALIDVDGNYDLAVYSLTGSLVWQQTGLTGAAEVALQAGIYVFQIKTAEGIANRKVVIK